MKANKIYLERLRKNDFVDRLPEETETFQPMTLKEFADYLQSVTMNLPRPKPNFPKGGAEFISDMNLLKSQPIELGSTKKCSELYCQLEPTLRRTLLGKSVQ